MHEIGSDVVEQPLVVGDDDGGILLALEFVHTPGHDAQGIDVETAVGLVENREAGLQHGHLENLVAFLLTARETLVDRAAGQLVVELDNRPFLAHEFQEVGSREGLESAILALLVHRRTHEVDHAHTRDFDRVLETEEEPFVRTVFGREGQQVLAVELDRTASHLIGGISGQYGRERALARTVGTHNGMHLARFHHEVDAFQYLFAIDTGMQVCNLQHRYLVLFFSVLLFGRSLSPMWDTAVYPTEPSSEICSSF